MCNQNQNQNHWIHSQARPKVWLLIIAVGLSKYKTIIRNPDCGMNQKTQIHMITCLWLWALCLQEARRRRPMPEKKKVCEIFGGHGKHKNVDATSMVWALSGDIEKRVCCLWWHLTYNKDSSFQDQNQLSHQPLQSHCKMGNLHPLGAANSLISILQEIQDDQKEAGKLGCHCFWWWNCNNQYTNIE